MSKLLKNREDIIFYLDAFKIKNYKVNDDLTIDTLGDVDLRGRRFTELLVKFNLVHGNFNCSMNLLTSLDGCPNIVLGHFECGGNQLKSLANGPKIVGRNYSCILNPIESLDDFSTDFRGVFKHSSHIDSRIEILKHLYNPGIGSNNIWTVSIKLAELNAIKDITKMKQDLESELSNKNTISKKTKI